MSDEPIFDPVTGEILDSGTDQPPVPVAMSLDDARALLAREHQTTIGADDPILMSVTLHQAFCADLDKLLARHGTRVSEILAATGNSYAEAVEQTLESLKDKTVRASLEQSFALISELTKVTETLKRRMRRYGLFHTFLTLVSLVSCVLALAILSHIVR